MSSVTHFLLRLTLFQTRPIPSRRGTPGAQRIAAAGLLHLDHLGAELAERGRHQGAGRERRGVDDPEPGQREVRSHDRRFGDHLEERGAGVRECGSA